MKKEIIDWFKFDRSFNKGVSLYFQYGISKSLKAAFNRQGNTKYNYEVLCEQLRMLAGISVPEYQAIMSQPVSKATINNEASEDLRFKKLLNSDRSKLSYAQLKAFIKQFDLKPADQKKDSLIEALDEFIRMKLKESKESDIKDEDIDETDPQGKKAGNNEIPIDIKKTIKLRDEFPFLKEEDCPDELKILVADMLTAYDNYRAAHPKMFEAGNEEELQKAVSDVVENYLENQEIWKELNYYKENGEILGEHPIFNTATKEDLNSLTTEELFKRKDNLEHSIWRNQKLIDEGKKPHLNKERTDRINGYKEELAAVEAAIKAK